MYRLIRNEQQFSIRKYLSIHKAGINRSFGETQKPDWLNNSLEIRVKLVTGIKCLNHVILDVIITLFSYIADIYIKTSETSSNKTHVKDLLYMMNIWQNKKMT